MAATGFGRHRGSARNEPVDQVVAELPGGVERVQKRSEVGKSFVQALDDLWRGIEDLSPVRPRPELSQAFFDRREYGRNGRRIGNPGEVESDRVTCGSSG